MNVSSKEHTEDILDRDRPGPVSVAYEARDVNPPKRASIERNVKDDALDRDRPGPVSVSLEGTHKPSYTYNADKSDPIDPNMADHLRSSTIIETLKGTR